MVTELSLAGAESGGLRRTRWGAVVAVAVATVLVALDMSVVAVVLPDLGGAFDASPSTAQWAVLAYLIPLVALSVPAGRWLDSAGPLPSYLLSVVGFGVASLLIACAPAWWVLLAGRALQGVFGALVGVVAVPVIAGAVREDQRARALGVVLTLIPLGGVVGPALAGVLADAAGWRSIFLVNLPVVAIAVAVGARTVPVRAGDRAGLPLPDRRMWLETALLAIAVSSAFIALDLAGRPAANPFVALVLVVVGAAAVVGWRRLPVAADVRTLWRQPAFRRPILALPMVTTGVGALNFLVPYLLADRDVSTSRIGAVLLAFGVGMAACSPIAGPVADRIGHARVAVLGAVVTLAGTVSLLTADSSAGPGDLAWRLAVVGAGNGLFASPNAAAVMAATPAGLMGLASGVTALLRTFGFALGPALGALVWVTVGAGMPGFRAGLMVLTVAAVLAVVLSRPGRVARPAAGRRRSRVMQWATTSSNLRAPLE